MPSSSSKGRQRLEYSVPILPIASRTIDPLKLSMSNLCLEEGNETFSNPSSRGGRSQRDPTAAAVAAAASGGKGVASYYHRKEAEYISTPSIDEVFQRARITQGPTSSMHPPPRPWEHHQYHYRREGDRLLQQEMRHSYHGYENSAEFMAEEPHFTGRNSVQGAALYSSMSSGQYPIKATASPRKKHHRPQYGRNVDSPIKNIKAIPFDRDTMLSPVSVTSTKPFSSLNAEMPFPAYVKCSTPLYSMKPPPPGGNDAERPLPAYVKCSTPYSMKPPPPTGGNEQEMPFPAYVKCSTQYPMKPPPPTGGNDSEMPFPRYVKCSTPYPMKPPPPTGGNDQEMPFPAYGKCSTPYPMKPPPPTGGNDQEMPFPEYVKCSTPYPMKPPPPSGNNNNDSSRRKLPTGGCVGSNNPPPPPPSPSSSNNNNNKTTTTKQIEVMPNVFYPLRGAEETSEAIRNGTCTHVNCLSCNAILACVKDCVMVICPVCRVLSPVENNELPTFTPAVARRCLPNNEDPIVGHETIGVPPFVVTEDDDDVAAAVAARQKQQQYDHPPTIRNGVGLGLKIAERSYSPLPSLKSSCHF